MKWMRFFVLSALICLMLVACGSDKPSQKQMKPDLEQTGRFSYQIEDVTVLSERGDREDYHANVKISGSDSLMEISDGGELQYRKSGGKWILQDYSSDDRQARLVRCPTEEEIFSGFSTLEPLENYLPCPCPRPYSAGVYQDPNCLGDSSVIENVIVSDIRMESDSAKAMSTSFGDPIYTSMISFAVSYRETYHDVCANINYRMYYKYHPSKGWNVIADAASCTELDYSALNGRQVGNGESIGYIESFLPEYVSVVLDGERYEFFIRSGYSSTQSQFECLSPLRGGGSSIEYKNEQLNRGLSEAELRFSLEGKTLYIYIPKVVDSTFQIYE